MNYPTLDDIFFVTSYKRLAKEKLLPININ
jgi:hypothetical protein